MRVLFVVAFAAALAGCTSVRPQQPIPMAVKAPPPIAAGMKERPMNERSWHHKRAGRSGKTEVNATRAGLHSSVVGAAEANKVKGIVAAKLGNPAAIAFQDIEAGTVADSFCGVAQVKGASGEAREIPFVVHGNEVFVINGSDDGRAAAAIHRMCD